MSYFRAAGVITPNPERSAAEPCPAYRTQAAAQAGGLTFAGRPHVATRRPAPTRPIRPSWPNPSSGDAADTAFVRGGSLLSPDTALLGGSEKINVPFAGQRRTYIPASRERFDHRSPSIGVKTPLARALPPGRLEERGRNQQICCAQYFGKPFPEQNAFPDDSTF